MSYPADIDIRKLIATTIELFQLDLKNYTILTEAANGNFFVTPVIAALSGAQVYAYARDTGFGKKEELAAYVTSKAQEYEVEQQIEIIFDLPSQLIREIDIVTNLGSLRPLDAAFIGAMSSRAVITSMCEAWEVRNSDIDRAECRRKGVLLGAVNEESPVTNIFKNVGYLAEKLILETGLEISRRRYLIVSSDKFGRIIAEVLQENGACPEICHPGTDDITAFQGRVFDALIVADYSLDRRIIGVGGFLTGDTIKKKFSSARVIHLAGEVDYEHLQEYGISCYPEQNGYKQKMTRTLDYLSIKPLIELHTAGLKVGEILVRERIAGRSGSDIQKSLADHPLCQLVF